MKMILSIVSATMLVFSSVNAMAFEPAQPVCYSDPATGVVRSLAFDKGDFGSQFYRIPAIATLPDGTIVAVADKRVASLNDLPGEIDIVCRRSTDGGRTWGPYITVASHTPTALDSIGGIGDPALVYDRRTGDLLVIATHGQGLWREQPGNISVMRSNDGGLTWSEPLNINPQIMAADNPKGRGLEVNSAFASSGAAYQLKSGRLMFVLVTRNSGEPSFPCYAIYSDDGGYTWKVSETPTTLDGDESKLTELSDGTLVTSIRVRSEGPRRYAVSTDGGRHWSEMKEWDGLNDVACNGDIIHYTHNGADLLIHSLPAGPWRSNITLYASSDNGKTWPMSYQLVAGPGAYSAMTVLPDGSLGVLSEEGVHDCGDRHHNGYRIWFTRVPIELLVK